MSRVPHRVRLLKDKWTYRLEVTAETLKALGGTLNEGVIRADAERRLTALADDSVAVSLPAGIISAEPEAGWLKVIVDPRRPTRADEAILLDYDEAPIGVVAAPDGRVTPPLGRAKLIGVDTITGLPAYMAP